MMSTPSYRELVAAVRREGEAILAAGRLDGNSPDAEHQVPTCPGWTTRDLLVHVGRVYRRAGALVSERATTQRDYPPEAPADADAVAYLADGLDDLVEALSSADGDTPVWNWSDADQTAMFWARRMAHESAIHRYDAERAHDVAQPVSSDLARDGLDELVDVLAPRVQERDGTELPEGTLVFDAGEEGCWNVRLGADGVERLDVAKQPDVTVRGTPSALLLAAYGRIPWSALDVDGDTTLLDGWSQALRF